MKLRTKITLIAALVILIAAAVSDGIIWFICRRTLMHEAEQTVYTKMLSLQTDYLEFNAQSRGILSDSEQRFFFKQRGDDYVICLDGTAEIYNQTVLTPSELLEMDTTAYTNSVAVSHGVLQISGHRLLIARGESAGRTLYAVHDLADVIRRLRLLALGMLGVLLGVCIPAVIVLYLLLRRTMKPLGSLSDSAKQIAAGAYEERAAVSGNDEVGLLAQDFNLMANAVQEKINALAESEQRKTM
ncbi:MAG: HAMP domain-containing protein, partial [Oscillospiraceae bacterium]|nr:HAMP domain-containing protein [Oscillospiraceae bacterium]